MHKPWNIGTIHWGMAPSRPTHITVQLDDPQLYSAVEQFAKDEALRVIPSEVGQRNERWIVFPGKDIDRAMAKLDQYILKLYQKLSWARESKFKVGDKVQIVEFLWATPPQQQPIAVQLYDRGIITDIVGFNRFTVAFENSSTIPDVPAHNLRLL